MTRSRTAAQACWLALALLAGCNDTSSSSPDPGRPFATADLAGDWHLTLVFQGPSVAAGTYPGWVRGTIRFDATGTGQVLEVTDSAGNHPTPANIAWHVAADGMVTSVGTAPYTAFHGTMNRARDLVVATATQQGQAALRVYQRIPATASRLADVGGKSFWVHELDTGESVGWEHSRAAIDASGVVALTDRVSESGPQDAVPDVGTLAVAADGTVTVAGDATWQGYLSAGGELLVATNVRDATAHRYAVMVITRALAGAGTADFAGTSEVHLLSESGDGVGSWLYGSATADAAGHVTFGDWFDASGPMSMTDTPTVSVAGDGELLQDGSPGYHGALLPAKDVAVILNAPESGMGSIGFSIR
jgi:hypothetical protein